MGRLATQGWPWGFAFDGATLVAGRGESFARTSAGELITAPGIPASGDVRAFRGYYRIAATPLPDPASFTPYDVLAAPDSNDWWLTRDSAGVIRIAYGATSPGTVSGVPNGVVLTGLTIDGAWHRLDVAMRFGPDGYFGVMNDGTIILDDPEFDYAPISPGAADYRYRFFPSVTGGGVSTDVAWTDLAVNDDTWAGPGKTVLGKPAGGGETGGWTGATSWADTGVGGGAVTSDIPGSLSSDCRRGIEAVEQYDAAYPFAATNLGHVPPAPESDFSGDGELPGGDFASGLGFMVSSPGSGGSIHKTWRPATDAESTASPGDPCYHNEWVEIDQHHYGSHGTAAPGDNFDVDIDTSAVTGTVGWAEPQALIAEGATVLGASTTETEEYVTLRKPGDSAPAAGAPNRLRLRDHGTGGSTPGSYQLLRIPDAGAIPALLTVTRNVGGDQIVNCCAAGVAIDCDNVAQPPLPDHEDGMWIA